MAKKIRVLIFLGIFVLIVINIQCDNCKKENNVKIIKIEEKEDILENIMILYLIKENFIIQKES